MIFLIKFLCFFAAFTALFLLVRNIALSRRLKDLKKAVTESRSDKAESLSDFVDIVVETMNSAALCGNDGSSHYKKMKSMIEGSAEKPSFSKVSISLADIKYEGFSQFLKKRFPDLTPGEIEFCCMLVIGVSPNCISMASGYEHHMTFYNKRTRIRKKMGLESDDSLDEFLHSMVNILPEWNLSRMA